MNIQFLSQAAVIGALSFFSTTLATAGTQIYCSGKGTADHSKRVMSGFNISIDLDSHSIEVRIPAQAYDFNSTDGATIYERCEYKMRSNIVNAFSNRYVLSSVSCKKLDTTISFEQKIEKLILKAYQNSSSISELEQKIGNKTFIAQMSVFNNLDDIEPIQGADASLVCQIEKR